MTSDDYTPEELRLADRLAWMNNASDVGRTLRAPWTMEQAARWLVEHGVGFTDAAHDAGVRADQAEKSVETAQEVIASWVVKDRFKAPSGFRYPPEVTDWMNELNDAIRRAVALTPTTEETEQ